MAEETNVVAETVEQPAATAASPAAKPKKAAKAATSKAAKSPAVKRTRPAADKKVASPAKAVAAAPKPKKVVKSAAGSAHPPYLEMVTQAVIALKERKGSSRQAILKYILANFQVIYFYYFVCSLTII